VQIPHLWQTYYVPEQALMRLSKRWTILRSAFYAEAFLNEAKIAAASGAYASLSSTPVNFISRDDLAAAAAGLLTSSGHDGAIYQATGPVALSGPQRAEAISKAAHKPVSFAQVPLEQYKSGLAKAGIPPQFVDLVLNIQEMWATGGLDVTTGDVEHLSGQRPRALADVLASALG
jgi:NAD(P)H dehydrogenase (quinone)